MEKIIRRGRLNGFQQLRLNNLLDMLYTPREIANELRFSRNQFYSIYLPGGCPSEKKKGQSFINGKLFREWYERVYPKLVLLDNEAFCMTCKVSVPMINPVLGKKDRLSYWICSCGTCGRHLTRIISIDKRTK